MGQLPDDKELFSVELQDTDGAGLGQYDKAGSWFNINRQSRRRYASTECITVLYFLIV